jgi:hypothetical protein
MAQYLMMLVRRPRAPSQFVTGGIPTGPFNRNKLKHFLKISAVSLFLPEKTEILWMLRRQNLITASRSVAAESNMIII